MLMFAAVLAGGSIFTSCQVRLRDAFVDSTRNLVFSLLDPVAITDLLLGDGGSTESP